MSFEDALGLLAIDAEATPRDAKRAYMRQVKRHKPETDPEGFRRVREAYELAASLLSMPRELREHLYATTGAVAGDDAGPLELSSESGAAVEGDSSGIDIADAPRNADADDEAADDEAADDEAADDEAADDEAADDEDDVGEEHAHYYYLPQDASPEQMDQWLERVYPQQMAALGNTQVVDGGQGPLAWQALQALAVLALRDDWQRASALQSAIARWQGERASLEERFQAAAAARWALLSELVEVGPRLDRQVAQALATSVLKDDANAVTLELYQYHALHPDRAHYILVELKGQWPVLHAVLAEHWRQEHVDPGTQSGSFRMPAWPLLMGVFALVQLLRLCASGDSHTANTLEPMVRPAVVRPQAAENTPIPSLPEPGVANLDNVEQAYSMLLSLSARAKIDFRDSNQALYDAFVEGSCAEVEPAFHDLEQRTRAGGNRVRAEVQRYWAEYLVMCPLQSQSKQHRPVPQ